MGFQQYLISGFLPIQGPKAYKIMCVCMCLPAYNKQLDIYSTTKKQIIFHIKISSSTVQSAPKCLPKQND